MPVQSLAKWYKCKMGVAGLYDSYLMFLMPFVPSICFERVFYIKFVKEDFSVE